MEIYEIQNKITNICIYFEKYHKEAIVRKK